MNQAQHHEQHIEFHRALSDTLLDELAYKRKEFMNTPFTQPERKMQLQSDIRELEEAIAGHHNIHQQLVNQ